MTKEELFRECVLCDNEAQGYEDGAEFNLLIVKAVIEKNDWHGEYVEWLCDQDCRQFKRCKPFPNKEVVGMLE